jgi:hypothetical protein
MITEIGSQIYTNKNNSQELPFFLGGLGVKKRSHNFLWKKNQSNQQQYQAILFYFWVAKFCNLTIFFRK